MHVCLLCLQESATVAVAGAEPIPRPSDKAMKALEAQGIRLA